MTPIMHTTLLLALIAQTGDLANSPFVELYKKEAAQYEFHVDEQLKLTAHGEPVFRWVSSIDPNFNGTLFVWTHKGRAEVVGSIWSHPRKTGGGKRKLTHEFLTLSSQPVRAERSDILAWHPPETKMTPIPIPGAPKPADTAADRLVQMRALAREFKATEVFNNNPKALPMLSRPIYRSEQKATNSPDGIVFAFVMQFDPEAFLVIEERDTPDGRRWHFALAQFGIWPMTVRYKEKEVWACGKNDTITDPQNTHFANFKATYTDWNVSDTNDGDANP